jgi:3-oxoacyl-[acyl-carrier protein] reductase
MTAVVLGPGDPLSRALAEEFGDVVVGHVAVDDTIWQTLVSLQTARSSMAPGGRIVLLVPTIGVAGAAARSAEQHTPADLSVSRLRRLP